MPMSRRELLGSAAAAIATGISVSAASARTAAGAAIQALAFDAFAIFDPRPVFALAEALFPERGAELGNAWRTRQFEYQWLRALSGRYADFWQTTEDALLFAAELLKLDLVPEKRQRLMDGHLALKAWPDVASARRRSETLAGQERSAAAARRKRPTSASAARVGSGRRKRRASRSVQARALASEMRWPIET